MFVPIVTLGLLGVAHRAAAHRGEIRGAVDGGVAGRLIDLAGPKGRRKEHTCRTGINRFICRRSLRACSRWRMPVALPRRRPARPCARSTSGSRLRRRTWCTPPPMWPRSWASSPSAASTPTSSSSRRPVGHRERCRRAGSAIVSVSDVAVGRGMKVQQFWGLAPRMPQAYMVAPDIKTAADLKGKRLSHRRRRRRLQLAHGARGAADRRPDGRGRAIHPGGHRRPAARPGRRPDRRRRAASRGRVLAKKQKPTLNLLVQLAELMPDYMFNAYGASLDWIARDRALLRDTAAAMIEANRTSATRPRWCRSS